MMFLLRDSKSVLIDKISIFLPDMLESRSHTNWKSPKGKHQKDNREIIKRILETCLSRIDALQAMQVVESCRSESSIVFPIYIRTLYIKAIVELLRIEYREDEKMTELCRFFPSKN